MPVFRTQASANLNDSIRRLIASGGGGVSPLDEAQVDSMAANTVRNMTLAEKARAEVQAMQAAEARRNDPALRTEYAANSAGIDLPDATRLSGAIRGQLEQPSGADMADANAVGAEARPFPMARPNLQPGQERLFRAALASVQGLDFATGHTNAEQLAKAGGEHQQNSIAQAVQEHLARGDVQGASALNQGARPGTAIKLFDNVGNTGAVFAPATGTVNADPAAQPQNRLLAATVEAERALAAQRRRGEDTGGSKPPSGYTWGPNNAQGQPTLVPIQGGPAAPVAPGQSGTLAGGEFLASLTKEKAAQVKALAEGRMQFPGGFALKSPYWQDMLSSVAQYDPTFDYVNYNARSKTRNAFVAGREGQSLNALNTVMGHMDDLEKAATALNNSGSPLLNKVANAIGGQMSPDLKGRLNAFKLNVQAVATEMERAYRGTGGNMAEIEEWKRAMDASDSPQAIRAGIRQAVKLLGSKIDALGEQYSRGMGQTKNGLELLTPKAQATYNRLVVDRQEPAAAAPGALPPVNAKGWKLMQDANGNKAYVSPDGAQFEEAQ